MDNHSHRKTQSGNVLATDVGCVEINLDRKPHRVEVFFTDPNPTPIPCNPPPPDDFLTYSVFKNKHHHGEHERSNKWVLKVCWDVTSFRDITWIAHF